MQRSSLSVNVSHSTTLSNRMFIQHQMKRGAFPWHLGQNQRTKAAPSARQKSYIFQVFPPHVDRRPVRTSHDKQPIYPLPENTCKFKLCETSNYLFHSIKRLHQQWTIKLLGWPIEAGRLIYSDLIFIQSWNWRIAWITYHHSTMPTVTLSLHCSSKVPSNLIFKSRGIFKIFKY